MGNAPKIKSVFCQLSPYLRKAFSPKGMSLQCFNITKGQELIFFDGQEFWIFVIHNLGYWPHFINQNLSFSREKINIGFKCEDVLTR